MGSLSNLGCFCLLFLVYKMAYKSHDDYIGRGISGSFFLSLLFSRSQVIIKKSSNDNFFGSKKVFEWKHHHLSEKLSFEDFLMITSERENESERKKEPQIPGLELF